MIRKRIADLLVILVLVTSSTFTLPASVSASTTGTAISTVKQGTSEIVVKVNGNILKLDHKPYLDSDSKVFIPLAPILKQIDNDAAIRIKGKNIIIKTSSLSINFNNMDKNIIVNGKLVKLSTAPILDNGQVFAPLEFISLILNELVDFDSDNNTVSIYDMERNTEEGLNKQLFYTKDKIIATKLDDYLTALQKSDNFHGSVLIAKDGDILLNKGYNMADFGQNIKNTPQTRFLIGSMTKQFTAMAIMQLEEKGLLSEQDKLSKYLPDFPHGDEITIYNLLTHTSGIKSLNEIPGFLEMKPEDLQNINIAINFFKNQPLDFKPGTQFEYSNSGYLLLGYIVERVSGMSYENYLEKNIFKPFNMNNTGIAYMGKQKMYNSNGYQGYLDVIPVSDEIVVDGVHGAGNLYSTTEDLYRWSAALSTDKLASKETMNKIFSKYVEMAKDSGIYYGYGWMVADGNNGHQIFHGGNVLGYTSDIAFYTDKGITIIILTNNGYYSINPLTYNLSNIVLGNRYDMPKARKVINIDSSALSKYAGKYGIENSGNILITNEGGHLYYSSDADSIKYELYAEGSDKFFLRILDGDITFDKNSQNEVTGMDIYAPGYGMQNHVEKIN